MTEHRPTQTGRAATSALSSTGTDSALVNEVVNRIQDVLSTQPVDTIALANHLTSLAKAFSINLPGRVNPPLGGRQKLGLVPPLPLPPVAAGGQTFFISHSVAWSFTDNGRPVPAEDVDAENLNSPDIDVLLKPKVVEAPPRAESPRPRDLRLISPAVTLTLTVRVGNQTVSSGPVSLPQAGQLPTVIRVLPLEVPTLLALFRHKKFATKSGPFDGFVLIDVSRPAGLTDEGQLKSLFTAIGKVGETLTTAFATLPGVIGELGTLARRLFDEQPMVRVISRHELAELKNVGIPNPDSALDAGNSVSSLVFIGVGTGQGSRAVECWSGKIGNKNDPYFKLTNGRQGFAIIKDLHSDRPVTLPDQSQFVRGKKPGGGNSFGDAISAIRFVPPLAPLA